MQPDTRYGFDVFPWWNNRNDRVAYEREFSTGMPQRMRMAQALISQSPLTPDSEIKQNMTVHGVPSRTGYPVKELTIVQILDNEFQRGDSHIDDSAWNDFSGEQGESNATQRPALDVW